MRVRDLMADLERMDPDAKVYLAMQPSWPFQYSISDVVEVSVSPSEFGPETDRVNGVYLVEGEQLAYLNSEVAQEIGW